MAALQMTYSGVKNVPNDVRPYDTKAHIDFAQTTLKEYRSSVICRAVSVVSRSPTSQSRKCDRLTTRLVNLP